MSVTKLPILRLLVPLLRLAGQVMVSNTSVRACVARITRPLNPVASLYRQPPQRARERLSASLDLARSRARLVAPADQRVRRLMAMICPSLMLGLFQPTRAHTLQAHLLTSLTVKIGLLRGRMGQALGVGARYSLSSSCDLSTCCSPATYLEKLEDLGFAGPSVGHVTAACKAGTPRLTLAHTRSALTCTRTPAPNLTGCTR